VAHDFNGARVDLSRTVGYSELTQPRFGTPKRE
jgi:hypothetical protein